jgi:hypothetical protein
VKPALYLRPPFFPSIDLYPDILADIEGVLHDAITEIGADEFYDTRAKKRHEPNSFCSKKDN